MKETKKHIEIVYDGLSGTIDLNTFIMSQVHLLALITEVKEKLLGDQKFNIQLNATKEGSFTVDLVLIALAQFGLFNKNQFDLDTIISTIADIFKLFKYLSGTRAASEKVVGDRIEITITGDNNTVNVSKDSYRIYQSNQTVNRAIQQTFVTLEDDDGVHGFRIKDRDKGDDIVSVDRKDFQVMTTPNEYLESEKIYTERETTLFIKKADIIPKGKYVIWNFMYPDMGSTIKATIRDQEFIKKINGGERFGQGDGLKVLLKTEMEFSEEYNSNVATGKYDIMEVYVIVRRPAQRKLF